MSLEDLTGTLKYIDDFVNTNPAAGDSKGEGDDHIRGVKNVLLNTFPNIVGIVTATQTELNYVDITTLGTAQASKAVTTDASSDVTGINIFTATTINQGANNVVDDADIGVTVEAYDSKLADIAALAQVDGEFLVSNGTTYVAEASAAALVSIGIDGASGNIAAGDLASDIVGHDKKIWSLDAESSWSVTGAAGQVIPEGMFSYVNVGGGSGTFTIDMSYDGGSNWRVPFSGSTPSGVVISDGTNVRMRQVTGTDTVYYRRLG